MEKRFNLPEFDYEVILGKYAKQADGSVWFQQGGTVVLATVCSAKSTEFPGFFPLTVDYREHSAAAGKIPGGYLKREGRSTDKEILTSRLIDRAIRPLFPENYFDSVQIISTVYSVDREHTPYTIALLASSLALVISKIPFLDPVGAVEVARIDGKFVVNPKYQDSLKSDVKIVVAGTEQGICMVEGRTNELSESEYIDAFFLAHDAIKKQIAWFKKIANEIGVTKEPIVDPFNWQEWKDKASKFLTQERVATVFVKDKEPRSQAMQVLKQGFFDTYKSEVEELNISESFLTYILDEVLKDKLTERIFSIGKRIDGRDFEQVREISTQVGILPFNHGSALFNRGGTQALVSVTLGGGQDEQKVEDIMQKEIIERSFMLHYNFPPFSVGEVRPLRGAGRREIGHGYLAASALKYVLPSQEKFPYTIRIVADMLGSDGSTSMATVCGSTMSLMDAGVPITDMVSGVAMGLIQSSNGEFKVLTDIAGIEDAFGLMDFKVAGTSKGITAIQMDIKHKEGLRREVFEQALSQATRGRLFILDKMKQVMSKPNAELSELVPQIRSFKVPTDKIGAIIGSGGKVIREIIDKTGTTIDIEEDGTVKIFGHPGPGLEKAVQWVKVLGGLIEKGSKFTGQVKRVVDFGIFVEIVPGKDGLVHVSNMPKDVQSNFMKTFNIGDLVTVEVLDYDEVTDRIRLKLINKES